MPSFEAMANLCGLRIADKVVSCGMMVVNPNDIEHNNVVIAEAVAHGKKLAETVKAL